jgi:hypothetical protein
MSTWTPVLTLTDGEAIPTSYSNHAEIQSINISGGRYDTTTQPTGRTMTVQLTPLSSFTPPTIADPLQLYTQVGEYAYDLFNGMITDITFSYRNYSNGTGIPTYTITAMAAIGTLEWNRCTPINYSQDYAGAQILAMMSDWGIGSKYNNADTYNSTTIPQTGGAVLNAITHAGTENLYDEIRASASSAGGVFYDRADGTIWYDRRSDRSSRSAFTLTASDIDSSIAFTRSITAIGNDVTVIRNGTDAKASDSTSIGKFGRRTGERNTRLHNLTDAQTLANSFIAGFKSPVWRPEAVSCTLTSPDMSDTTRINLLGVFCGSKVTIPVPSQLGGGTATYFVENFTWTTGVGYLNVSLGLAPTNDSI